MNDIASELRATADALERACRLAQELPAGVVDADSALALYLDAPRVLQALAAIAGSLDPAGEELVGELWDTSPARRKPA